MDTLEMGSVKKLISTLTKKTSCLQCRIIIMVFSLYKEMYHLMWIFYIIQLPCKNFMFIFLILFFNKLYMEKTQFLLYKE